MKNLLIDATKYTPMINFDSTSRELNIKGNSYPENTVEFYEPIINWMSWYLKLNRYENVTINLEIVYFNSSSSKVFFEIFDLIDELNNKNSIKINWVYEEGNDSIFEIGEDYKLDFENLDFNLVKKDS